MTFKPRPVVHLDAVTLNGRTYKNVAVSVHEYYVDSAPAIRLEVWDEEFAFWEPLASATVNLRKQGHIPAEGCTWIRDDRENSGALAALTAAGLVESTGRNAYFGFEGAAVEARLIGAFA